MNKTCRFCNSEFKAKPEPKQPDNFECLADVQTFVVGSFLSEDVCEAKRCKAALQHECDECDAYRKGE